jgi:virginiamycin B lyase
MKRRLIVQTGATSLLAHVAGTSVRADDIAREARIEAEFVGFGYFSEIGFGSLWSMTQDKLARLDLTDNSITYISTGGPVEWFGGIAIADDGVWGSDGRTYIYKFDPKEQRVIKTVQLDQQNGSSEFGLAVGEGTLWAIAGARGTILMRYSAASGIAQAMIPLPARASGIVVAFGSVWVTGTENDVLYRIDPTSNQIAATIELGTRPRPLAAGEGSIWVINEGDGTVQRFDGDSGRLLATIETNTVGKSAIVVGGGFVWITTRLVPLIQIDPRTNSVRGKFRCKAIDNMSIRYGGGSLWMAGALLQRIKPPD